MRRGAEASRLQVREKRAGSAAIVHRIEDEGHASPDERSEIAGEEDREPDHESSDDLNRVRHPSRKRPRSRIDASAPEGVERLEDPEEHGRVRDDTEERARHQVDPRFPGEDPDVVPVLEPQVQELEEEPERHRPDQEGKQELPPRREDRAPSPERGEPVEGEDGAPPRAGVEGLRDEANIVEQAPERDAESKKTRDQERHIGTRVCRGGKMCKKGGWGDGRRWGDESGPIGQFISLSPPVPVSPLYWVFFFSPFPSFRLFLFF